MIVGEDQVVSYTLTIVLRVKDGGHHTLTIAVPTRLFSAGGGATTIRRTS